jgi:hypothetical protein
MVRPPGRVPKYEARISKSETIANFESSNVQNVRFGIWDFGYWCLFSISILEFSICRFFTEGQKRQPSIMGWICAFCAKIRKKTETAENISVQLQRSKKFFENLDFCFQPAALLGDFSGNSCLF